MSAGALGGGPPGITSVIRLGVVPPPAHLHSRISSDPEIVMSVMIVRVGGRSMVYTAVVGRNREYRCGVNNRRDLRAAGWEMQAL